MKRLVIAVNGTVLPLLVAGAFASAASAADLSGHVAGEVKVVSSMPLSGDRVANRVQFKMTVVTDDPTNPFNLASQDCMATYVFAKDDKPLGGHGYCDGVTQGGDIWWISVRMDTEGKVHWSNLGGTGALAGVEASGTTQVLAEFPDGKVIGRFEGTRSK